MNKKLVVTLVAALMCFAVVLTGKILAKSPYADSQKTRYDYAVEDLTSKKIINGFPDGNFHPYDNVTRAQFAKMIVIAIDKENEKTASVHFNDISDGHWAFNYVKIANKLKIVQGYEDDTFKPEKNISYAEAVTMALRALGYEPGQNATGHWYTRYMELAEDGGLLENIDDMEPNRVINRGNTAILIYNMLHWNEFVYGDVTENGRVNNDDLNLLEDYLNNKETFSNRQKRLADVNLDGKINEVDYWLIYLNYKKDIDLPHSCGTRYYIDYVVKDKNTHELRLYCECEELYTYQLTTEKHELVNGICKKCKYDSNSTEEIVQKMSGNVYIKGTAEVGNTLTVDTSKIVPTGATYTYEWYYCDNSNFTSAKRIYGETSSKYKITSSVEGKYIFVVVTVSKSGYETTQFRVATDSKVPEENIGQKITGSVDIVGDNTVGSTLYVDTSKIEQSGVTIKYQWFYSTSINLTDKTIISGQTSSKYTITNDLVGKYVGVIVTVSKTNYVTTEFVKVITSKIIVEEIIEKGMSCSLRISGTPTVGGTLTVDVTKIAPSDAKLTYQWYYSSDSNFKNKVAISRATSKTLKITSDIAGKYVGVVVTASKTGYVTSDFEISTSSKIVEETKTISMAVGISGFAQIGRTISAKILSVDPSDAKLTYQWYYSTKADFSNKVAIKGETAKTYEITSDMSGKYIGVVVTATKTGYTETTCQINLQETIEKNTITGSVKINGDPTVGGSLTVDANVKPSDAKITYNWYYSKTGKLLDKTLIPGQTSKRYMISNDMKGKYIIVEVTVSKDGYETKTFEILCDTVISAKEIIAIPTPTPDAEIPPQPKPTLVKE